MLDLMDLFVKYFNISIYLQIFVVFFCIKKMDINCRNLNRNPIVVNIILSNYKL